MSAIDEIREKIKALQIQELEIISKEKQSAIAEVKNKIATHHITAVELGFAKSTARKVKPTGASSTAPLVKYRKGELTWSGGRGPKPGWVKELIAKGDNIEQFKTFSVIDERR